MREVPGSIPGAAHVLELLRCSYCLQSCRHKCVFLEEPFEQTSGAHAVRPAPDTRPAGRWRAHLNRNGCCPKLFRRSRGESGWCSDMTSTHGVWRHAGVRFLLSGGRWPKPPSVRQSSWVKPASRSEPKATRSMAMEIHCQCLKHSWVSEAHMAAWSSGMILA